ncbi:hypothetical protein [Curtobacterium luteum]|uniref:hypothetical protein n=1 Tax=Curtobacterium luteum TaxID=33881 RepID=UPI000B0E97C1|nr:hypothetical protein [Curtobacterium luteum]
MTHICTYKHAKIRACDCLVGHDHTAAEFEWLPGVIGLIVFAVAVAVVLVVVMR